ncbi:SDR family oxidoreductase [Halobacillus sp. BAB-2008]|uniref:elongation factor P 5-aminopentanone reductase n=1 Tax=Halobacillus sp. BAB-2008 TaxID=1246484 RepID=UPI0002A506D9|nr:SDR family oxidoreductase [Halobacillus sp. BAB-2008]ELK44484.1 short-chain dehydrogenase/reductase family protein [Halobacillus sp. BAB-2008]
MRKRCLVIGASGDIGSAAAAAVIGRGFAVGLHYHSNEAKVKELVKDVPPENLAGTFQSDLSKEEGILHLLSQVGEEWDALVFAGGPMYSGLFQDMAVSALDTLYHTHVKALWLISRHLLPYMIRNKSGNIVVVSSIYGTEGASMEVAYSSVKGAQDSFVKALAKEVAPSGVRVNAVAPGFINTKMNEHLQGEERLAIEEDIPMGRAGEREEVAGMIGFLLGTDASYVTGQVLHVNGGWS